MNEKIKYINSGKGLGIIKFGMFRPDIMKILGEPNEKEKFSYNNDDTDLTESWHYENYKLSISFDQEDDWRLGVLTVYSEFYQFKDKIHIGIRIDMVQEKLSEIGASDLDFEDWSNTESPNHILLSSEMLGMNFWFDNGILTEIQWSPFFEDEETILWPIEVTK